MKFEYDENADGAFLWLIDDIENAKSGVDEVWPKELGGNIGILFEKSGKLIGFEFLNASVYLNFENFNSIYVPYE